MLRGLVIVFVALGFVLDTDRVEADSSTALWDVLRSGSHIALLRHAIAPGTGDPAELTIGDCSTQRNLSQQGRVQAMEIGTRFRINGIPAARVFSSQWCRCLDTAALLQLGPVRELPSLNSFFHRPESREPQLQGVREWIAMQEMGDVTVLVTHQVNITALTGVYPAFGELVIIHISENGDMQFVGNIAPE